MVPRCAQHAPALLSFLRGANAVEHRADRHPPGLRHVGGRLERYGIDHGSGLGRAGGKRATGSRAASHCRPHGGCPALGSTIAGARRADRFPCLAARGVWRRSVADLERDRHPVGIFHRWRWRGFSRLRPVVGDPSCFPLWCQHSRRRTAGVEPRSSRGVGPGNQRPSC